MLLLSWRLLVLVPCASGGLAVCEITHLCETHWYESSSMAVPGVSAHVALASCGCWSGLLLVVYYVA